MHATLITPASAGRWASRPSQRLHHAAPTLDPLQQMERDDRADWQLLRLVVGLAAATVALAVASSFMM